MIDLWLVQMDYVTGGCLAYGFGITLGLCGIAWEVRRQKRV